MNTPQELSQSEELLISINNKIDKLYAILSVWLCSSAPDWALTQESPTSSIIRWLREVNNRLDDMINRVCL